MEGKLIGGLISVFVKESKKVIVCVVEEREEIVACLCLMEDRERSSQQEAGLIFCRPEMKTEHIVTYMSDENVTADVSLHARVN